MRLDARPRENLKCGGDKDPGDGEGEELRPAGSSGTTVYARRRPTEVRASQSCSTPNVPPLHPPDRSGPSICLRGGVPKKKCQNNRCDEDQDWRLSRSFDESVLLWHIATELCFYQKGDAPASHGNATGCREISNYMIYLLFVHPEMLLPGARRNLVKTANAELKDIFMEDKPLLEAILKDDKPSLMEILKGKGPSPEEIERRLVDRIIAKVQPTEYSEQVVENTDSPLDSEEYPAAQEGFIHDAWKISELLLSLGDEKMWKMIEGVWVEMLCFSASRCRGFLHAKRLGTGGELLTYIWLLLSYMGMETLPERVQRRDLSSGGGNTGAAPSTSRVSIPTGVDLV